MRCLFRPLLAFALALTLVVTAQGMAVARGAAPAVERITLCTGHGPAPLYLDAKGAPTAPPHVCPDCVLFFAATIATEADGVPWRTLSDARFVGLLSAMRHHGDLPRASARGPPRSV